MFAKPDGLFDRDAAWEALDGFAADTAPGPRLGVVTGRLRQGKTYLLRALTGTTGGFLYCADDAVEAESLRRLGDALALHTGSGGDGPPRDWAEALDALLALGEREPLPMVLDEFPRLVRQSPSLPAVLHTALRRRADSAPYGGGRARLLLSGSSHPVMRRLFCGPSPLTGLVALDLDVRPFGFREAARFWGIDDDPLLALRVHAVVGGTPAYRHALVADRAPGGEGGGFDDWVCGTVLDPRTPLFHEAAGLVHEEADSWDRALCHSVLAAVALGAATPGEVANGVGASLGDVSHALALLQEHELLDGERDALRPQLTRLRVTEPLMAFEHAVVRPHRALLHGERGRAAEVWARARPVFESAVLGPHFAGVCRAWVRDHAAPGTFGGVPGLVGHGSLAGRSGTAAEVVVRGEGVGGRPGPLLSVGLARWGEVMDVPHLERLRSLREALGERGEDVGRMVPACYGAAGFGDRLREAEAAGEVVLVGAERLYRGA